jgi:competence protein ComEC
MIPRPQHPRPTRPRGRTRVVNVIFLGSLAVSVLLLALVVFFRDDLDGDEARIGQLDGDAIVTVAVFDVGQALSVGVVTSDGHSLLYDFGLSRANVEEVIVPFFRARGVERIDYAVLSHPHQDHVGGLPALLETMPIGVYLDPVIESTNQTYARSLEMILDLEIPAEAARRGDRFSLGEHVSVDILWPTDDLLRERDGTDRINDNSTVLRLTAGSVRFLLTGDIERDAEAALVELEGSGLHVDVLQVAHHGSNSSTADPFLEVARPSVAIVSAGHENRYGHPHVEPMQRLRGAGSTIYRTDVDGTVTIRSDGDSFEISVERTSESWRTPQLSSLSIVLSTMKIMMPLPSSYLTMGSN